VEINDKKAWFELDQHLPEGLISKIAGMK
jgi:hypothetical protein